MGLEQLHYDSKLAGRLMLTLQKIIVANFNNGDWQEIGYATGHHDYITRHPRLLRSLGFGDEDYGGCVYQVLTYLIQHDVDALNSIILHEKIRPELEQTSPGMLHELGYFASRVPTILAPPSASEVVRLALADAEKMGAISSIDRLHTALHGYLRSICANEGLQAPDSASLTVLFKALRTQHPLIQSLGTQDGEIGRVLVAFASVLDSLNTLRNHASVAHPNEFLLDEDEAELVVNVIRTVFNYLAKKLG
jgi:hypothetical protein